MNRFIGAKLSAALLLPLFYLVCVHSWPRFAQTVGGKPASFHTPLFVQKRISKWFLKKSWLKGSFYRDEKVLTLGLFSDQLFDETVGIINAGRLIYSQCLQVDWFKIAEMVLLRETSDDRKPDETEVARVSHQINHSKAKLRNLPHYRFHW